MGITLGNTPQKIFGIQFAIWFITVVPFMLADFILVFKDILYIYDFYYGASCWSKGTSYENNILRWFLVDAFTRLALIGQLIIFGIIMIVLNASRARNIAIVQKTFSIIIFVFFLFQLAWSIVAIVLIATRIAPANKGDPQGTRILYALTIVATFLAVVNLILCWLRPLNDDSEGQVP